MIELFFMPGAASLAPHIALEEAGADYRLVRVTRDGTIDPPEFLEVNPHGRIPAMRDGELRMYESAACLMHIADLYPGAGLAPALGHPRARALLPMARLPDQHRAGRARGLASTRRGSRRRRRRPPSRRSRASLLVGMRDSIDGELAAAGRTSSATRYSGADVFLFMLTRWGRQLDPKWWDCPNLGPHFRAVRERPAVQRVFEQEGSRRLRGSRLDFEAERRRSSAGRAHHS